MRSSCARATALVAVSISAFMAGCETTPGHKVFPDDGPTIDVVTRRTALQQAILTALEVDTRRWQRPTIRS